jgi:hypothetical protein
MCESRCCWFLFFSSPFIVLEALMMMMMQWSNPIFCCVAMIMGCISMTVSMMTMLTVCLEKCIGTICFHHRNYHGFDRSDW